ncbi:MAG: RecX family transcriptional regulator [Chitinophagaceae bacterium]|jgi:regulatory protein|nr:RecX family transcriptional regulator [Chitinophagaceae bacterium]
MQAPFSRSLNPEQAFAKAKHYCAYQERSHVEVKEKLYSFGLKKYDVEILLSRLIEENYLNEERFAKLFAGGKFRIKKWGRVKIVHELKKKRVSPYNINKALEEIDEEDYTRTLHKFAAAKWASLKSDQHIVRQAKTQQYLLQKGFEAPLVRAAIASLRKKSAD